MQSRTPPPRAIASLVVLSAVLGVRQVHGKSPFKRRSRAASPRRMLDGVEVGPDCPPPYAMPRQRLNYDNLLHRDARRLVRKTSQPRRVVLDIRRSDDIPEVAPPEPRLEEVRLDARALPLIWRQRL